LWGEPWFRGSIHTVASYLPVIRSGPCHHGPHPRFGDLSSSDLALRETLRKKVATPSRDQLAEARRQALEAFRAYSTDFWLIFPAKVLIVSGSKDGST
jgi:hypothetical protein